MSFDIDALRQVVDEDTVARVLVAATRGSVPREAGTAMLVTATRTIGTIGGGALEYEAIARARDCLVDGRDRLDQCPLGPSLGQCCGGAVTLLTEVWSASRLSLAEGPVIARPVPGAPTDMPLSVKRRVAGLRNGGVPDGAILLDGWMIEPVSRLSREIWIWGAGHVGRALVSVLAPLPGVAIHWADSDEARYPPDIPKGVQTYVASNPADLVTLAGRDAEHYVLTYSHAIDLEICHRVLSQPFRHLGLIGSATKRARFRTRLAALGHGPAQIDRMICPVGDPALGKHPQEIALGIGAEVLQRGITGAQMIGQRA